MYMKTKASMLAIVLIMPGVLEWSTPARASCDADKPNRTPAARYVLNAGEAYDRKTDLTWQRCSIGQHWKDGTGCVGVIKQVTWDEATAQASKGWRMPNKDELLTLISPSCHKPAINEEVFPDMELDKLWYWTSSDNGPFLAWLVDFADGQSNSFDRTDLGTLRLVRDGDRTQGT
jgi:Protein of unknown function (DUF1566)